MEPIQEPLYLACGESILRRILRIDPTNLRAPFHLPLLHTLVEERVGGEEVSCSIQVHGEGGRRPSEWSL
jgi:hypothetical protein